ncbi:RtcB family protein [candidate division KSB1 bacterium]|nr:RtcB family protein [candidate division KSB1 bacterium]
MIKISDYLYEIPAEGKMRVPARIYASPNMLNDILADKSLEQAKNVATLPGIVGYSYAMPDIHAGYGFPIGGVAAFDARDGVVSPGGVGYDINCGVRLLKTGLEKKDIENRIPHIVDNMFSLIPSGVGSTGSIRLSASEERKVLRDGAKWAVSNGYGSPDDLDKIEENGTMHGADPSLVSDHALKRGKGQIGTLGSGNHFVEVGFVQEVFDEKAAERMGLYKNQVTLIIHTGSRGFGHQVCDDYLKILMRASQKYGIELPDRQLSCAPIQSREGQDYLAAMACAVNFSFCNRQMITAWAQKAFERALKTSPASIQLAVVYEVAHNIAKMETHTVGGKQMRVCVHRKGATRAFGPGHDAVPADYRDIGQPVLIPGDMGRYSYVLLGTEKAMQETFGSTCHGAGRLMSRSKAKKKAKGREIHREIMDRGIYLHASSYSTIAEEMPEAYKDVADVVQTVSGAGISKKVVKLKPLGVIKG